MPRPVGTRTSEPVVGNAAVLPPGLRFRATDPDLPAVQADSQATATWQIKGGRPGGAWALTVQTGSAAFTGCARVPVRAVTVRCIVAAGSAGRGGSATCGAPFQLSNQPQVIATGSQGVGDARYTVTIRFSFQDEWQYAGAVNPQCTLDLNYVIQAF